MSGEVLRWLIVACSIIGFGYTLGIIIGIREDKEQ